MSTWTPAGRRSARPSGRSAGLSRSRRPRRPSHVARSASIRRLSPRFAHTARRSSRSAWRGAPATRTTGWCSAGRTARPSDPIRSPGSSAALPLVQASHPCASTPYLRDHRSHRRDPPKGGGRRSWPCDHRRDPRHLQPRDPYPPGADGERIGQSHPRPRAVGPRRGGTERHRPIDRASCAAGV